MGHVRRAPYHPRTQGKIERRHQTVKNRILVENYYLPGDLEASVGRFLDHDSHRRYHESLSDLTPADVHFGRGQTILLERERIKRNTIQNRTLAASKKPPNLKLDEPIAPVVHTAMCSIYLMTDTHPKSGHWVAVQFGIWPPVYEFVS